MAFVLDNENVPVTRGALWFSRLFFFRRPLQAEVPEFSAALAWMRRRWTWLLGGYLVWVGLLVVPGLVRGGNAAYLISAVMIPHVMLYLLAMMTAYSWVGFRVNLRNFKVFLPQYRRTQRKRALIASAVGSLLVGAAVGYFAGAALKHGSSPFAPVGDWIRDSFPPWSLALLFFVVITAVPEIIAQLRLREHDLASRLSRLEADRERDARRTAESELRLLQAQVEPHFLYNTLANLRYLVQQGSPDALRMTDALIEYLRSSVPAMRVEQVSLGGEADHVGSYLQIMQLRMGHRLTYLVEVPENLRAQTIPPLVLLTLVENAIKHGIAPRIEGGNVSVTAQLEGDELIVAVEDDGVGLDGVPTASPSSGAGLANVRDRLRLTFGDAAGLELAARTPRGTRAMLRIPLQQNQSAP